MVGIVNTEGIINNHIDKNDLISGILTLGDNKLMEELLNTFNKCILIARQLLQITTWFYLMKYLFWFQDFYVFLSYLFNSHSNLKNAPCRSLYGGLLLYQDTK